MRKLVMRLLGWKRMSKRRRLKLRRWKRLSKKIGAVSVLASVLGWLWLVDYTKVVAASSTALTVMVAWLWHNINYHEGECGI